MIMIHINFETECEIHKTFCIHATSTGFLDLEQFLYTIATAETKFDTHKLAEELNIHHEV